jgi:hypothetical protein
MAALDAASLLFDWSTVGPARFVAAVLAAAKAADRVLTEEDVRAVMAATGVA